MAVKVTVGHEATSKASIPIRVEYKCSFCGKENNDENQTVTVKGKARDSVVFRNDDLMKEATSDRDNKIRDIIDEVSRKKYRRLALKCKCSNCGKAEPWAKFVDVQIISEIYTELTKIRAVAVILFWTLLLLLVFKFWIWCVLAFLILLPYIYAGIKNTVLNFMVRKLADEALPHIYVRDDLVEQK